jgi:hypothetical protein
MKKTFMNLDGAVIEEHRSRRTPAVLATALLSGVVLIGLTAASAIDSEYANADFKGKGFANLQIRRGGGYDWKDTNVDGDPTKPDNMSYDIDVPLAGPAFYVPTTDRAQQQRPLRPSTTKALMLEYEPGGYKPAWQYKVEFDVGADMLSTSTLSWTFKVEDRGIAQKGVQESDPDMLKYLKCTAFVNDVQVGPELAPCDGYTPTADMSQFNLKPNEYAKVGFQIALGNWVSNASGGGTWAEVPIVDINKPGGAAAHLLVQADAEEV